MSAIQGLQFFFGAVSVVSSCVAQGCCWYHFFKCCGCIDPEQERINQPQPQVQMVDIGMPKSANPFMNPNAPRDMHLQSAYG